MFIHYFTRKVREICTHYVDKCSGKYENNKVAARYVYQMADEVICQLAGVAAQIKSARNNQPENLQELLDEWNENFPPSLGALGTPKTVASTLTKQCQELATLRSEHEIERANHAKEIAEIMQSMSTHLHASCEGVMSERRQLSFTQQQQTINYQKKILDIEAQNKQNLSDLNENYEEKMRQNQNETKTKMLETSSVISKLKADIRDQKKAYVADKEATDRIRKNESESTANQIYILKKQILSTQGVVSPPTAEDCNFPNDDQAVVSLSYDSGIPGKALKTLKLTGIVAKAVKQLKEVCLFILFLRLSVEDYYYF